MMDNPVEKEIILYTCGMCNRKVAENAINKHSCLKGYNYFYIDGNQHFYPRESFEMDNDPVENGPMENDPEENDTVRNNQDAELNWRSTKTVQEEQLIEEIHKRPALWNFKLPLVERSLKIKKKLWEEVSTSMNCMDVATVKKKWKSLCDSFRVYKNKQHQPSGSAGSRKNSWVHYDRMQFLCDDQFVSETATNINLDNHEELDQSNDEDSVFCDGSSSSLGSHATKKRRLNSDTTEDDLDRLTDILKQPVTVNMPRNPLPPPDSAALFGNLVAAQLRDIQPQFVDDTMILQILSNAKRRSREQ